MPTVDHVIIFVKENHTFDNYFGSFPEANGKSIGGVPDAANDPLHDHETCLRALDGAGGVQASYSETDIGAYWSYAKEYTLCDNYFTDVASQSEPNHLYTFAAHSPIIDNASRSRTYQPQPPYDLFTLPQALEAKLLTWKHYSGTNSSYFEQVKWLKGNANNVDISKFDAARSRTQTRPADPRRPRACQRLGGDPPSHRRIPAGQLNKFPLQRSDAIHPPPSVVADELRNVRDRLYGR